MTTFVYQIRVKEISPILSCYSLNYFCHTRFKISFETQIRIVTYDLSILRLIRYLQIELVFNYLDYPAELILCLDFMFVDYIFKKNISFRSWVIKLKYGRTVSFTLTRLKCSSSASWVQLEGYKFYSHFMYAMQAVFWQSLTRGATIWMNDAARLGYYYNS